MTQNYDELMKEIVNVLNDKLAFNVEVIKVGEVSIIADYFVIASGRTDSHVSSLFEYVDEAVKKKFNLDPLHTDGVENSKWIVVDYGGVIVHLFRNDEREFYSIDKIWEDAPRIEIEKKQVTE